MKNYAYFCNVKTEGKNSQCGNTFKSLFYSPCRRGRDNKKTDRSMSSHDGKKTIKAMIDYSISMFKNNLNSNAEPKAYARAQMRSVVGLEELAEHITAHNSKYNEGDVYAVMVEMVHCMREFLLDGHKVQLGKLGAFSPAIHSRGAESLADFTANNIKSLTVNWSKGSQFINLKDDAEFNFVPTRAAQELLKKAVKAGETTVDLSVLDAVDVPAAPVQEGNVTITAVANTPAMGTVTGGGSYVSGATVTLKATPNAGYTFVSWSNGKTTPSITVTATANATYTATFAAEQSSGSGDGGNGGALGDD